MKQHLWKDDASCLGLDNDLFFETYEEDLDVRPIIDSLCSRCPVAKKCFAVGVSSKEWGIWGGVYLESGEISREFSSHRTKLGWAETWQSLTMDK
jgi:hypothetical protein